LQCCAAAARAAGFGTVVLVPTGQPLLKIPDYRLAYAIDWPSLDPLVQGLADQVVTVPQLDISATEIRRRVAAGEPIDTLVPSEVRKYIEAHRLYIPQP